ncbi:hypothetical protein CALCODRAFT_489632, partial [Calocera cornea HHB12733]
MDPLDYHLELLLESFTLPDPVLDPEFTPHIISLKLICEIPKTTYSHALKTVLPSAYGALSPNPRISRLHLDGFANGFPAAFVDALPRLFPNITHLVIERSRIASWPAGLTKALSGTYNPHQGLLDLLRFYITPRPGVRSLQIFSLRDADADPFYVDAGALCSAQSVPSVEVICTSGRRNATGTRVLDYPAILLAPFLHQGLVTLNFGLRSDGTEAPTAPAIYKIPELYKALTERSYDNLQLLDLTMVAYEPPALGNIVRSTPNVLMVKLSVSMPVSPPHPTVLAKKAADDLIDTLKGWTEMEEIELIVPLTEELIRAVDRAKKEDKQR